MSEQNKKTWESLRRAASAQGRWPELSAEEKHVIVDRGTEPPFSGRYCTHHGKGVYLCRRCGAPLYLSEDKFDSGCGWPSFDDEIHEAVRRRPDADGRRTEIVCAGCGGHLGHVFSGERQTPKDARHCVNSASLMFVSDSEHPLERAIFAGGCFWGVEHSFRGLPGIAAVRSGYTGGAIQKPTYEQVCSGTTGHAEAVEVLFDPAVISFEKLARYFFRIHDPTQKDRQGPDRGTQYRSAIFYTNPEQKETAERLIRQLRGDGREVVTEGSAASTFWPAEDYHQRYLEKHGAAACHVKPEDSAG